MGDDEGVGGTCHNDKPGLLMMLMMMMMMMVRMMMMVMTRMMMMMMRMMMMMMMVVMLIMMMMLTMRMPDPIKGWSEIPPHQRGGAVLTLVFGGTL